MVWYNMVWYGKQDQFLKLCFELFEACSVCLLAKLFMKHWMDLIETFIVPPQLNKC